MKRKMTRLARGAKCEGFGESGDVVAAPQVERAEKARYPKPAEEPCRKLRREKGRAVFTLGGRFEFSMIS
jgi:hypothetical protein